MWVISFAFPNSPRGTFCDYPHFTEEEAEAQRGQNFTKRHTAWKEGGQKSDPGLTPKRPVLAATPIPPPLRSLLMFLFVMTLAQVSPFHTLASPDYSGPHAPTPRPPRYLVGRLEEEGGLAALPLPGLGGPGSLDAPGCLCS